MNGLEAIWVNILRGRGLFWLTWYGFLGAINLLEGHMTYLNHFFSLILIAFYVNYCRVVFNRCRRETKKYWFKGELE